MHRPLELLTQYRVDQSVTLDELLPFEGVGHDQHVEVGLGPWYMSSIKGCPNGREGGVQWVLEKRKGRWMRVGGEAIAKTMRGRVVGGDGCTFWNIVFVRFVRDLEVKFAVGRKALLQPATDGIFHGFDGG